MQQNRPAPHLVQHALRSKLDFEVMRIERGDQLLFSQRPRAEMIFERFCRDRALHGLPIDERRERQQEVPCAILRGTGRKRNVHGHHSTQT
jgi:hypothetical protein